jgi:hypothetical protein
MMAKIIILTLHIIRNHQEQLHADGYIHLIFAIYNDANINANNMGQQVILSSSLTDSSRYMHEKESRCHNLCL